MATKKRSTKKIGMKDLKSRRGMAAAQPDKVKGGKKATRLKW